MTVQIAPVGHPPGRSGVQATVGRRFVGAYAATVKMFGPPWPELTEASKSVLLTLLIHGPTSRAELSRRSGLSPASLTRITRSLSESGLVLENPAALQMGAGRPAVPVAVNPDVVHLLGVNLTATTLTLVRTDILGRVLFDEVTPLADHSAPEVIETVIDLVRHQVARDPSVRGVGVSLAGPISPTSQRIGVSPFLGWQDVSMADRIEGATGLSTVVENDVRALTAAEHWFGGAAGVDDFLLVTIGAGVACGMVIAGRLIEGVEGRSGQIGHLPITSSGPLCERGHRGCVRSYLASSSIIGQVAQITGRSDLDYASVLAMATAQHPAALRIVQDAAKALGQVIGTVAAVTGPEKVLVSGEGVGLAQLTLPIITARAVEAQHWAVAPPVIEVAPFGATEWARGAAVIALRRQLEMLPFE